MKVFFQNMTLVIGSLLISFFVIESVLFFGIGPPPSRKKSKGSLIKCENGIVTLKPGAEALFLEKQM